MTNVPSLGTPGHIALDELNQCFVDLGERKKPAELNAIFKDFDADNSGTIDRSYVRSSSSSARPAGPHDRTTRHARSRRAQANPGQGGCDAPHSCLPALIKPCTRG